MSCRLSYPPQPKKLRKEVLSQKEGLIGVCQLNSSKWLLKWHCDLTCKTICAWSTFTQLQLHPHHWHWHLKKITTLMKQCILGIGIGNSPLQYLNIGPYNSYHHCKEICICRCELFAKCYH